MSVDDFINSQEPLGAEFQKILDENISQLYEVDTKITWTNCADEMPPHRPIELYIVRRIDNSKLFGALTGYCIKNLLTNSDEYQWTKSSPEKWKELNNGRD